MESYEKNHQMSHLIFYPSKWSAHDFMVSISSFKYSFVQNDLDFVRFGPD